VNATDRIGSTALTWAAGKGHAEVVKMLLEREGVNPDRADTIYGRTPISWAVEGGMRGSKGVFRTRGVNPDWANTLFGRAPISWTAGGGAWGSGKDVFRMREGQSRPGRHRPQPNPTLISSRRSNSGRTVIPLKRKERRWIDRAQAEYLAVEESRRVVGVSVKGSEERVR